MLLTTLLLLACSGDATTPQATDGTDEIPRTGTRPVVEAVDSATDSGTPTGDTSETGTTTLFDPEFDCANGEDDDEDELIDCDDPDCEFTPDCASEICDDGIDNEGDGLPDCLDDDCVDEPLCQALCADAVLTGPLPISTNGSTNGMGDNTTPTCTFSTAPDMAFAFTAPTDGTYTFSTDGSAYDTVLYLYGGCGGREITCNDDFTGLQSQVSTRIDAGRTVIVVVDGYSSNAGNFTLRVSN